jgi:peptidoglycan/LPS O-acetylase OafA/YrhL
MTTGAELDRLDPADARPFRHVPGLDGVRGVAVLLVVGLHFGTLWSHVSPGGLLPGGYIGVDVFFVLSGFLITSLLVGEEAASASVSFRNFYARRALRLLPALYVLLAAHALYTVWIGAPLRDEAKAIVSVVLYVANFAQVYGLKSMIRSGIGLTWSLAIEEQFYVVWPALLVLGVLRFARTRTDVLWAIGGGVAASALVRLVVWNWGSGYPAAYMRPDCRADGLLIGAMCAFLWRWDMVPTRGLRPLAGVSAGFLGFVAVFVQAKGFMFNGGFTLISLAAAVIILGVVLEASPFLRILESAPLRAIGKVSYGLYLWHGLALRIAIHGLPTHNRVLLAVAGAAIATIAVSASWFLIERPFLRLKKRVASPVSH